MLSKYLLKRRYQPGGVPYVVGDRSWSYVDKPKGLEWFFKRPSVKLNAGGFTYFYQGTYPLIVPGCDQSDGHSIPWPFVVGTIGFIRYLPKGLVWVAFAHDEACQKQWESPKMRADMYRESIWFAYDGLKTELQHSDHSWFKRFFLKQFYRTQNILMIGGVKVGSIIGAC